MEKTILHIDFDSFFASCEQHFNPLLRDKPIGVTAQNGRTCIIAPSREAKRYGIKTGTRSWEAKTLCKDIVFVPADFDRYLNITKKFISICSDYSPYVEVFSMDEVFIDLTPTLHLYKSPKSVIEDIKSRIREEIGPAITVSAGISYNKLLAKLASSSSKPNGLATIQREDLPKLYKRTPLTGVCGIGERYKRRLNFLGVNNFFDLQIVPEYILRKEFGNVASFHLKKMAYFEDDSEVIPYTEVDDIKSVGRNYCLPKNEYDQRKILQTIYELCCEVGIKLRKVNKKGKTIGLSLSGDRSEHCERTTRYTNHDQDIYEMCKYIYDEWKWNGMVRQIRVWVTKLIDQNFTTDYLLDNPKRDTVAKTVDLINERFGDKIVRNGFVFHSEKLTTKPNGYFGDKFIRKDISKIT